MFSKLSIRTGTSLRAWRASQSFARTQASYENEYGQTNWYDLARAEGAEREQLQKEAPALLELATKMFPKDLGLDIKHLMSIKVDPQHRTELGFPYDDAQEMEEKFEEITSTDEGAMLHLRYTNEQIGFRTRIWNEVHEMYNGPKRDYENYPVVAISDGTPRRLGIVPHFMLEPIVAITGMSGPYLIAGGTFLWLCNKQILLSHGDYTTNCALPLWLWFFWTYYWRQHAYNKPAWVANLPSTQTALHNEGREADRNQAVQAIDEANVMMEQMKGKSLMYDGYRENVELQLEEEYRKRMLKVHDAVVKRLDYHSAVGRAKNKFEANHMIDYVVKAARESITPQQEKEMMVKCFADLKAIAAKQSA